MSSEVGRHLDHQALENSRIRANLVNGSLFDMDVGLVDSNQEDITGSLYTLASTQSQFSYAVDNWIRGVPAITTVNNNNAANAEGSNTRPPQGSQRTTQPEPSNFSNSGIWYILAMILPLVSINNNARAWGCSASTILHMAQFFAAQLNYLIAGIHRNLRSLARDQVARDIFATAMDVVLIIYAMGFLVLSMYQASIFN